MSDSTFRRLKRNPDGSYDATDEAGELDPVALAEYIDVLFNAGFTDITLNGMRITRSNGPVVPDNLADVDKSSDVSEKGEGQ